MDDCNHYGIGQPHWNDSLNWDLSILLEVWICCFSLRRIPVWSNPEISGQWKYGHLAWIPGEFQGSSGVVPHKTCLFPTRALSICKWLVTFNCKLSNPGRRQLAIDFCFKPVSKFEVIIRTEVIVQPLNTIIHLGAGSWVNLDLR